MMVPQLIRFYPGYTVNGLMNEYARTVLTLANAMNRLKAQEMLNGITEVSVGMSEQESKASAISKLEKASDGLEGILKEVRTIKGLNNG